MSNYKVHYAIMVDFDDGQSYLGACFYKAWENGNIDYKLKYLWNKNTTVRDKVTCKRCLGMLRTGLRSLD